MLLHKLASTCTQLQNKPANKWVEQFGEPQQPSVRRTQWEVLGWTDPKLTPAFHSSARLRVVLGLKLLHLHLLVNTIILPAGWPRYLFRLWAPLTISTSELKQDLKIRSKRSFLWPTVGSRFWATFMFSPSHPFSHRAADQPSDPNKVE